MEQHAKTPSVTNSAWRHFNECFIHPKLTITYVISRVSQTHQDRIYGAKFHPMDNNLIVTYGKDHLSFWTRRRDGIFDAADLFAGVSRRRDWGVSANRWEIIQR